MPDPKPLKEWQLNLGAIALMAIIFGAIVLILWAFGTFVLSNPGCYGSECLIDGTEYQIRGADQR